MDAEAVVRELRREEEQVASRYAGPRGQADPPGALRELLAKQRRESHGSVEVRARMEGPLMSAVFLALCRRYGLEPYRRRGQKKSTYMLEGPEAFLQEVFWPLFSTCDGIVRRRVNRWLLDVLADFEGDVEPLPRASE